MLKSKEEVENIIENNEEFAKKLAWTLLSSWKIRLEKEEITSLIGLAIVEAAQRFKPEKGVAFRTFFFYYLRGTLLKEISNRVDDQKHLLLFPHLQQDYENRDSGNRLFLENLKQFSHEETPEKELVKSEKLEMIEQGLKKLDPLEKEIIFKNLIYDNSLVSLAKELGYCRCHLSRVKTKALNKLSEFILPNFIERTSTRRTLSKCNSHSTKKSKLTETEYLTKANYTGGRGRRKVAA